MSVFAVLALMAGMYTNARASSAPLTNLSWTVSKSYIVDKDNIGGKSCNDSWPGTETQPLCTVAAGLKLAQPGEGIFLRAATYPNFTVTRSGTNANYITISSYNGEKAVISGGGEAVLLKGVSYVRISGLEVRDATGYYGAGIRVTQSSGVSPAFNIIENNIVHDNVGSYTMGILIEEGSNNKVINNKVYNNYLSGIVVISHPANSPSGISGNEVSGNESYNNVLGGGNSDGIKMEGPGTKNTLVMNNIVHGNSDDGIDTWNSSYNTIVGNIAFGQPGPGDGNGFKLGGGGGGYNLVKQNVAYGNKRNGFDPNGTGGNAFYNNVAYNNGNFGFEDGWKDAACTPSSCREIFINNIGYNNTQGNFSAGAYTEVAHNNLWYSDSGSAKVLYNYASYSALSMFYSASGNKLDNPAGGEQASLQADPQFTDAANGIFTVRASSSAIDHGDTTNPGQVEAFNRVDIGAYENNSSPVSAATQTLIATIPPVNTPVPASPTTVAVTSVPATPTLIAASPIPPIIVPTNTPTSNPTVQATATVISPRVYDDLNKGLVYSTGWWNIYNRQASGGSYKAVTQTGASTSLTFTGQSFSILYGMGSYYGSMNVYIDGKLVGTIYQNSSSAKYQQRWDYSGNLPAGSHVLKLVTKNISGRFVSLDAVIVR